MLLMGMAVGVDYSLFYLKREREERAAGHEGHDGLFRAAATSGQAVLISGVTVLIAMAGMLFAGSKIFTSIGIGAMLVVFTSLVGSLTVLPALLGKLGDRIERGRPAGARGRRPAPPAVEAALARVAARHADAPPLGQGRPAGVPHLGVRRAALDAAPARLGRAVERPSSS